MKNFGKALAATAGLLGVLAGAPAVAGPIGLLAGPATQRFDLGQLRQRNLLPTYAGVCVQVVDKLFGGFIFSGPAFVPEWPGYLQYAHCRRKFAFTKSHSIMPM